MLTASKKKKGHALEALVRDRLIEAFNLTTDDIRIAVGSENGADVKLSNRAKAKAPFSIECKAWESFTTMYKLYEQASMHESKLIPLLVIKSNRKQPLVVLDLDHFLTLVNNGN